MCNYFSNINNAYREATKDFEFIFDNLRSSDFYKGVASQIDYFLENDDRCFFLQIPVEELGRDNDEKNFDNLTIVIFKLLAIHSRDELKRLLQTDICDKDILFYNYSDLGKDYRGIKRFFKFDLNRNCCKEIFQPTERNGNRIVNYLPTKINVNSENISQIIKLKREPDGNRNNYVEYCEKILKFSKQIIDFNLNKNQFKKILVVGYNLRQSFLHYDVPYNHNDTLVESTITLKSSLDNISNDFDLIVIIGDKKYKNRNTEILNGLNNRNNNFKKVIFIGSELEIDIPTYSFTYKEMANYFSKGSLPVENYCSFTFDFADTVKQELNTILSKNLQLSEEIKSRVIGYLMYNILKLDFNQKVLNSKKEQISETIQEIIIEHFGLEELPLDYELLNRLENYINHLSYGKEDNPKIIYITHNLPTNYNKRIIIPNNNSSWKRKLESEILPNNNGNNQIIFDSLSWRNLKIYKHLLRNGVLGRFYFLYYKNFEEKGILEQKNYLAKEFEAYNSEYRHNTTGVEFPKEDNVQIQRGLDDYDDNIETEINGIKENEWNVGTIYNVVFEDDTIENNLGNVIYISDIIGIDELYELWTEQKDSKIEITYYKNPGELFDNVVQIEKGFDVKPYSGLWKKRLISFYDEVYNNHFDLLFTNLVSYGLKDNSNSKQKIKNIVNNRYNNDFPDDLYVILNLLKQNKYLTDTEFSRVGQAKNSNNDNRKIGERLKDELYEYKLKKRKGNFLEKLESNIIAADELVRHSILTKTIKKITIKESKK